MDKSFNRDNFERLGVDKKSGKNDKVIEYDLGDRDPDDKEIDTKKTWKK